MSRVHHASEDFYKGIKRGIAGHHSGFGAKQRMAVEGLFRQSYLNVSNEFIQCCCGSYINIHGTMIDNRN